MQPYTLGIDLGTGSTKAVAVNPQGQVLFTTQAHYPPQAQQGVQDPEIIWQAFIQVVHQSLRHLAAPPIQVSLSSAMHSIMPVDRNGNQLAPLLTWADDRAALIASELMQQPAGRELYEQCGTPIHALSPLCKIRWWQQHEPALFGSTARFIGIKEWLWHRLFGVYEIDYALASATGLWQLASRQWYAPALAFAGISPAQLSIPVQPTFQRTGMLTEAAQLLQLPANTPVVIGASDGCLANLGSGATEPGVAAITIGTSGAVRIATAAPKPVFPQQLFNYYLDEETWITGGATNNGGSALQWLASLWQLPGAGALPLAHISHIPAGSNGLLFLPFLLGERAPIWDSESSAAFIGLRPAHEQAHLLRATIEGICFALRSILEPLEQAHGPVHAIRISGGFTRSEAALQVLADVLGKDLTLSDGADASALGAALLALRANAATADGATLYAPINGGFSTTIYHDGGNHHRYLQLYPIYRQLYQQLKGTMHQLQQVNRNVSST